MAGRDHHGAVRALSLRAVAEEAQDSARCHKLVIYSPSPSELGRYTPTRPARSPRVNPRRSAIEITFILNRNESSKSAINFRLAIFPSRRSQTRREEATLSEKKGSPQWRTRVR